MNAESSPSPDPVLADAHEALMRAMEAACQVDVHKADTAELIRVEEALQTAMKAAKELVSLRLKRRAEHERLTSSRAVADRAQPAAEAQPPVEHRVVVDENGAPWAVVAVYPSSRNIDKRTLPEKFAQGWLLFQNGDQLRRHAPVPERWNALSDSDLRFLFQNADVSTRRRA